MTVVDFTAGARSSQADRETQACSAAAGATDFPDGHTRPDLQCRPAVGEHDSQLTNDQALPTYRPSAGPDFPDGHRRTDAPRGRAVGEHNPPAPATELATPNGASPVLAPTPWAEADLALLAFLADALDDIEDMRTATANRLRQLTRAKADKDGEERGFGLTLNNPQVATVAAMLKAIKHDDDVLKELGYPTNAVLPRDEHGKLSSRSCACLECRAIRSLTAEVQKHPLAPWIKAARGVGEKQAARLLAAISDPYWHTLHNRPRLVSELWQYAGHGDPARSKCRKGQLVEYSPTAKMRVHLVAVSCMKNLTSPYRAIYEKRKSQTEGRLHAVACVRCGPSGSPALAGSPWSAGHRHADALRVTGKELLRDLWRESKRIHEGAPS